MCCTLGGYANFPDELVNMHITDYYYSYFICFVLKLVIKKCWSELLVADGWPARQPDIKLRLRSSHSDLKNSIFRLNSPASQICQMETTRMKLARNLPFEPARSTNLAGWLHRTVANVAETPGVYLNETRVRIVYIQTSRSLQVSKWTFFISFRTPRWRESFPATWATMSTGISSTVIPYSNRRLGPLQITILTCRYPHTLYRYRHTL
jgi:hypothetical protein